ncbi:MAG: UDP-N-acetylmuramoyl-L-alanine--D-glutamate ligase [Kiritimatiellia bacterium]
MTTTLDADSVLVLGLGTSGTTACRLLLREGAHVTAIDSEESARVRLVAQELGQLGIETFVGMTSLPEKHFDLCVTSPGIPADSPWLREMCHRGVPIISELELGAQRCRCPLLAVTGTNGKSTTVKLCGDILKRAGLRVVCAGNYGPPLSFVAEQSHALDWIVVEVSSFQLEWVDKFRPTIGVLLNVAPNHLDRHPDMETYFGLKLRLFANMSASALRIVPYDLLGNITRRCGQQGRWVSFGTALPADYGCENGWVLIRRGEHAGAKISLRNTTFEQETFGLNACAAVAATVACGAGLRSIEDALRSFVPLPHRMELVGMRNGVRFINDSKATNLTAMRAAVTMVGGAVRLIAGGLLKESDISSVKEVLARNVRCVYLIGDSAEQLARGWSDVVPCRQCGTLEEALEKAWKEAQSGETILLSPGCASFDQFENFEERGERFRELARKLCKE